MRKIPFLLIIITILFACSKQQQQEQPENNYTNYTIVKQWEIAANNELRATDGIIYNNEYLVFSTTDNGRKIISFDLKNKTQLWEYNLTEAPGWLGEMSIFEDCLILYSEIKGISILDLKQKKLVATFNLDGIYHSPPTYHNGNIYVACQNQYFNKFIVKSINFKTGEINDEYEWPIEDGLFNRLSSPLVFNDDKGKNFIMLLQLYTRPENPNFYDEVFLINVNEEKTLNWIDTLTNKRASNFYEYLPILIENNAMLNYGEKLFSYNIYTGEKNWEVQASYPYKRLISKNNYIYSSIGPYFNYAKFDATNGDMIWNVNNLFYTQNWVDFELFDDHIVFVKNNFGQLFMLNNNSGEYVTVENNPSNGIAHPKFYNKEGLFITHSNNKIVGFKLEMVN